ncbi:Fic family protein [Polymorphospora rubra]|uniref:Fic family protein n=1 Tax=Polymorphospora rubra TaxID=338584 RepID=UPI0033FA4919
MTTDDSRQLIHPRLLSWADVDPARHPFDADEALHVVRSLAPPVPPPLVWAGYELVGRDEADRWRETVTHALATRYGRWARGWCWGIGEADHDGGPVNGWCCASHSISSPDETLALVAASLVDWRGWLEDLAERFERFRPLLDPAQEPDDLVVGWEVAVAQLVTATVDRTRSESGWYNHCEQVLTWFLTFAGVPPEQHSTLITHAIGGRFHSWAEPAATEVAEVAGRLAQEVVAHGPTDPFSHGRRPGDDWPDTWPQDWPSPRATNLPSWARQSRRRKDSPPDDDLSAWHRIREQVDWHTASGPVSGPVRGDRDGIAEYVAQRVDGGTELSAALAEVRQEAVDGGPLTFARLARWQRTVLGVPEARFRTGPAWAKGGRERYYWRSDLPELFEQCLAEATDDEPPLPSRAARVYLDVAFFHPFDDGNARSAMLALYYVLAREGVVLDRATPLLMTVRQAHDALGAAGLAGLIGKLIGATRGRARTCHPHDADNPPR